MDGGGEGLKVQTSWTKTQLHTRVTQTHARVTSTHAIHCTRMQRDACNTLQHTATRCNTLQHTATHCNTLQHTATRCNRRSVPGRATAADACNTLQHAATHEAYRAEQPQQTHDGGPRHAAYRCCTPQYPCISASLFLCTCLCPQSPSLLLPPSPFPPPPPPLSPDYERLEQG